MRGRVGAQAGGEGSEFLEEYRWEPSPSRLALLAEEPAGTGDERWDVFLAALAEHLAARDLVSHDRLMGCRLDRGAGGAHQEDSDTLSLPTVPRPALALVATAGGCA